MLMLTIGLVAGGGLLYFRLTYGNTEPGIKHDGLAFRSATRRGALGWIAGVLMTAFYCILYWWDDAWGASPLSGGIHLVDPLAELLSGGPADKWFLYGAVYTLAVLVMGVRMVWRYRHSRYHLWRTASVSFFQLAFGFLIPPPAAERTPTRVLFLVFLAVETGVPAAFQRRLDP